MCIFKNFKGILGKLKLFFINIFGCYIHFIFYLVGLLDIISKENLILKNYIFKKYVYIVNYKMNVINYLFFSMLFFILSLILIVIIRLELLYPNNFSFKINSLKFLQIFIIYNLTMIFVIIFILFSFFSNFLIFYNYIFKKFIKTTSKKVYITKFSNKTLICTGWLFITPFSSSTKYPNDD